MLFIIFEIVSISIDLSWMFMPSWTHVSEILRLLRRLEASWGVLGRLKGIVGASWGVLGCLGASWARLGPSWARLGGVLGRLGGVLEASWAPLGSVLEAS